MSENKQTILVIDDEDDVRRVLRLHLDGEGYTVICASNGEEAVSVVKNNDIDLIICDVHMPKMDGFDFILQMKQENKELPIIAISGAHSSDSNIRSLKMIQKYGQLPILEKPFDTSTLLAKVTESLDASV